MSEASTMRRDDVTALIVAGGRATRFGGVDKRTLVVEGATIFERQRALLAPRVAEIVVSTSGEAAGFRTVVDAVAGVGPIAGIAAGLAAIETPWVLVVAGDMPHLRAALIDHMLARAAAGGDEPVDAVGIRIGGRPEPLLCVLRTAAAGPCAARRLAAGRYKASGLLEDEGLRIAWIEGATLETLDPGLRTVVNVNTPTDLDG